MPIGIANLGRRRKVEVVAGATPAPWALLGLPPAGSSSLAPLPCPSDAPGTEVMERMVLQVNEVEEAMQRLGAHVSPHPQQGGIPSLLKSVD